MQNEVKTCSKCGKGKPLDEFDVRSDTGRLRNECKECRKAANKVYREAHKQELAKRNRIWREANADHIKAKSKRYYAENRQIILEKQKKYYLENSNRVIDYQKKYREANADLINERHRRYWQDHLEERHAYQAAYKVKHADEIRERNRRKYRANPELAKQKNRENYWKHREKRLQKQRAYYNENRDWLVKNHTAWQVRKLKEDTLFKLKEQIRNLIRNSYRRTGFHKNSKTADILGCDFDTLNTHLRTTWVKNYGTEWDGEEYHIDHIIPLATAKTEEEVRRLCNYKNLQMLKPKDNLEKNDSLEWRPNSKDHN